MVCTPKDQGGLGVKCLRTRNLALRMRWRWCELTDKQRPWHGLSFSIPRDAESMFLAAVDCTLGNGEAFKFWSDPWIRGKTARQIVPSLWKLAKRNAKALTVVEALHDDKWIRGFRGAFTIQPLVEFWDL